MLLWRLGGDEEEPLSGVMGAFMPVKKPPAVEVGGTIAPPFVPDTAIAEPGCAVVDEEVACAAIAACAAAADE